MMQEQGHDTVDANRILGLPDDCREYSAVASMIKDLKMKSIKCVPAHVLQHAFFAVLSVIRLLHTQV